MTANEWIHLSNGVLEAQLAPEVGGSIARFDHVEGDRRTALLRPAPAASTDVLAMACFPLVPYCNRIRDGCFAFRGQEVRIAPNMAGDPSPLHGQGWLSSWHVARHDAATAELRFVHAPAEWPWRYEAVQTFELDSRSLTVTLRCTNLSDSAMPCGLGQHPYFPCNADTILDTDVETVWTIDEKVLPVEQRPATGRFDLKNRRICGQDLDHGFGGWAGTALIDTPARPFALRMSSPDARFFQVYSPPEGGLAAIEPVGHANAALNAPEGEWRHLGLQVLEPGASASFATRFELVAR